MRLICELTLSRQFLPRDYRRGFLSLIKSALQMSDPASYEKYYQQPIIKPFTFSVHFPDLLGLENNLFRVGSSVRFVLSSNQAELLTYLYNGLRGKALYPYPLFENALTLKNISITFPRKITQQTVLFKTVSPILINNKGKSNWYLMPEEEGFDEGLSFNIQELSKAFLGAENVDFKFEPLRYKEKKTFHYGQFMRGYHGLFQMNAPSEFLNLIFNIGLGNRRSQGFGMIDLV